MKFLTKKALNELSTEALRDAEFETASEISRVSKELKILGDAARADPASGYPLYTDAERPKVKKLHKLCDYSDVICELLKKRGV